MLYDVMDSNEYFIESGSTFANIKEVHNVANLVKDLLYRGVPPDTIGIITPYEG